MFATAPAHTQPFIGAVQGLRAFCLNLAFSQRRACAADREEANPEDMFPHGFDTLELLSGESSVTDWGLVEQAARLLDGWS